MRQKRKDKAIDDYDYDPNYLMIGAYGGFQPKPTNDKRIKPQIGFVRQEVRKVRKRK